MMSEELAISNEKLAQAMLEHNEGMRKFKGMLLAGLAGIGVVWLSVILLAYALLAGG